MPFVPDSDDVAALAPHPAFDLSAEFPRRDLLRDPDRPACIGFSDPQERVDMGGTDAEGADRDALIVQLCDKNLAHDRSVRGYQRDRCSQQRLRVFVQARVLTGWWWVPVIPAGVDTMIVIAEAARVTGQPLPACRPHDVGPV